MQSSVRIHPAPGEEIPAGDYTVTVEGQPVFTHQARVSAQPINQTWPGYQRPLEQTEIASFASWDMSGPVEVVVVSARPVREARVRPASRGLHPVVDGNTLRFMVDRPGAITVEINGMRRALHLFANPPETGVPDPKDPNVCFFGPGVHCPGVIRLTSGQTVYIDGGAVVYGAIIAENAENIAVRGRGILDGSKFSRGAVSALINTIDCQEVTIEGITLRDPCMWSLVPVNCRQVHIRNIKLIGHWRYNADGIDFVNCQDCSVEDTFVRSYDDGIVFKAMQGWKQVVSAAAAGRDVSIVLKGMQGVEQGHACNFEPVSGFRVRRCVLWCDWGRALEIGAETMASEITDLLFEDCDIIHSLDVAMEVQNGDRAHCHNLLFRNIRVELDDDQTRPMYQQRKGEVYNQPGRHISQLITLVTGRNMWSWSHDEIRGRVDDIRFENIDVTAWTTPEVYLAGCGAEHMVRDISIRNLRVNGRRVRTKDDIRFTIKPFVGSVTVEP